MQQTTGEKYSLCHLFRTSLPQCIGPATPSRIEPEETTPLLPRCARSFLFVPFFFFFSRLRILPNSTRGVSVKWEFSGRRPLSPSSETALRRRQRRRSPPCSAEKKPAG
ncbi:unnamed protein product [Ixodes persulcatus]